MAEWREQRKARASIERARRRLLGVDKLHLACGGNLLEGWGNVDLSGDDSVIALDLTLPLPVSDGVIRFVYSEHFIEHLDFDEVRRFLTECFRVMVSGGVIRLSTPDLRKVVDEYLAKRLDEWRDVGWLPATACRLVNEGLRSWGHKFVYDADELRKLLEDVGFVQVTAVAWRESAHPELSGLECRPFHGELVVEATRP